ncbi:MAG: nucleotide exchange factor GrpE [Planctomycetes bacterium]|nr:nucleotide exchange factor GrpE [Planctomycetota bacterium]
MSDSFFHLASSHQTEAQEDTLPQEDAPPQFGMVDVIEAFTAMRHEWRGQTKESRAVAESIQAAVTNIQALEAKLLAQTASSSTDEARKLAELIADIDNQLTRTVAAVIQSETNRRQRDESEAKAIQQTFKGMNVIGRWFARPLLKFVTEQRHAKEQSSEHSAVEGLNLVLARLRRTMKEHQIQRLDVLGQTFDAETMNAIGTLETKDYPTGQVAEQLSPSYRWRGRILRFADVRVAS